MPTVALPVLHADQVRAYRSLLRVKRRAVWCGRRWGKSALAETIACDVATALDPSQAVLICAGVDAAGNIVESFEPLTTSAASAQAFARRFPSVPAVHALVVARGAR